METTQLLRDLVTLPSVNPMGRSVPEEVAYEHRVTAYLEDYFQARGVRCERQSVAPLRDNLVAYSDLPGARRTWVLEVHQDTVPTDHMTIEPFAAGIADGRLYGRGACDIKGGMAAMVAAFTRLVREKPAGAANVILACTVDEEFTFRGVKRLVQNGLTAAGAIVAEPTQLQIVHAHKGVARLHLTAHGRSCHSSTPEQGVNAIYRMGRLLVALEQYAERLRTSRTDPLLGPPTLSVGLIEGGTSVNTVPERCRIEIDRRLIPGEDTQEVSEELNRFLRGEAGIDFPYTCDVPWMSMAALSPQGSGELVQRLGQAIDSVRGAHEVLAVPYGTDASTLAAAGVPAVVFGPGDIARAHTCDEWVPLDEVEQASEILYRFLREG
jgi:acetylornithine deacetylase